MIFLVEDHKLMAEALISVLHKKGKFKDEEIICPWHTCIVQKTQTPAHATTGGSFYSK
jgi:hypothetical protein